MPDGGDFNICHDPPGYRLRLRASGMIPENGGPDRLQVAQTGEFRYTGKKICQYCSPIVQIERDTGSKMIANGCFPAGDRLSDRPTVPEMKENGVLGSGPGLREWKSHGTRHPGHPDPVPVAPPLDIPGQKTPAHNSRETPRSEDFIRNLFPDRQDYITRVENHY